MARYETLEELVIAYRSGELDKSSPLFLDNDETFVYGEEDEWDAERIFDGGVPLELLIEALDLLGIPNEGI